MRSRPLEIIQALAAAAAVLVSLTALSISLSQHRAEAAGALRDQVQRNVADIEASCREVFHLRELVVQRLDSNDATLTEIKNDLRDVKRVVLRWSAAQELLQRTEGAECREGSR